MKIGVGMFQVRVNFPILISFLIMQQAYAESGSYAERGYSSSSSSGKSANTGNNPGNANAGGYNGDYSGSTHAGTGVAGGSRQGGSSYGGSASGSSSAGNSGSSAANGAREGGNSGSLGGGQGSLSGKSPMSGSVSSTQRGFTQETQATTYRSMTDYKGKALTSYKGTGSVYSGSPASDGITRGTSSVGGASTVSGGGDTLSSLSMNIGRKRSSPTGSYFGVKALGGVYAGAPFVGVDISVPVDYATMSIVGAVVGLNYLEKNPAISGTANVQINAVSPAGDRLTVIGSVSRNTDWDDVNVATTSQSVARAKEILSGLSRSSSGTSPAGNTGAAQK